MLLREIFLFILFNLFCNNKIITQSAIDLQAFRALSEKESFNFLTTLDFNDWDSITTINHLTLLLPIVKEKKDIRSEFYLDYIKFKVRGKLNINEEARIDLLNEMVNKAASNGHKIEEVVARHYLNFENYHAKKISVEQQYAAILSNFETMQSIGFEQFKTYQIQAMMLHCGGFMRNLEDHEKAFQYLTIAEQYIQPTKEEDHYYTMIMNNIQTYYYNKKDYEKAIVYAKKIYDFHYSLNPSQDYNNWRSRFWQGLSSLDIANSNIELGKLNEGEQFSIQGYELCKVKDDLANVTDNRIYSEFDALQVVIAIKLKLGKIEEAKLLLDRGILLKKYLHFNSVANYFTPLKFYRNCAKFYETKNDLGNAFRFSKLAETLQDSLNRRNDAHKLESIKQRHEAEKYISQINLIEREKQLQKWLKNAAILIMLLVTGLAFVNYRRILHKRKLALQALEEAKNTLAVLTNSFREKSEFADNLRLEMERLSNTGERSEYLEKLTHSTILTEEDWLQFRTLFEKVHPHFIDEQKRQIPGLTTAELRLLVLEKLQLSTSEMANMLGVSRNTINQTKLRLRKKIG